jgi:hypothetical protein
MLVASDDGVNPGDEFAGIYVRLLIFLSYLRFQGLPFLKIQVINLVELLYGYLMTCRIWGWWSLSFRVMGVAQLIEFC